MLGKLLVAGAVYEHEQHKHDKTKQAEIAQLEAENLRLRSQQQPQPVVRANQSTSQPHEQSAAPTYNQSYQQTPQEMSSK